jgi:predicted transcriptional regulator of viral defense system
MKFAADQRLIQGLAALQDGVFARSDLQAALADPHNASLIRRIATLEKAGTLRRFSRGWYVTEDFSLAALSQRIAPKSYVSFGTVLAKNFLIGTMPSRRVQAVKLGKARRYAGLGFEIEHFGSQPSLIFGFDVGDDGVAYADSEKAVLDTLYYHLRGVRYVFDIYSDIAVERLDRKRLRRYLARYQNEKFVTFAQRTLAVAA